MAPIKTAFLPFIAQAVHISIRLLQRWGGGGGRQGRTLFIPRAGRLMDVHYGARAVYIQEWYAAARGGVCAGNFGAISRRGLKGGEAGQMSTIEKLFFFFSKSSINKTEKHVDEHITQTLRCWIIGIVNPAWLNYLNENRALIKPFHLLQT